MFLITLLGFVLCASATTRRDHDSSHANFAVVGYVPEWRFDGIPFDLISPRLTHLILFSIETDSNADLVELDRLPSQEKMAEIRRITRESNTNLLISFGGYGRSNGFPKISISKQLRLKFVKNAIGLIEEHGLNGMDLNWEYPQTQRECLGLFEIINSLKKERPNMILTMAFYPKQENILNSKMAKDLNIQQPIDLFLMMSYDNSGKHSTFDFAVESVQNAIESGLDPQRLAIGVPFYGRNVLSGEWITYQEIVAPLRAQGTLQEQDIKKMNMFSDYYYNGYDLIVSKTRFALESKIGGIMIWENGQDIHGDALSLLAAIANTVREHAHTAEDHSEL